MLTDDLSVIHISSGRRTELVHLPSTHPHFQWVELWFQKGWKHPEKPKPPVRAIFEIRPTEDNIERYETYRDQVSKTLGVRTQPHKQLERLLFHGTSRACLLGADKDSTRACKLSECYLCSIIDSSFDVAKCGKKNKFRRFGNGIYTTSCSSKADDYVADDHNATYKVMLACRVCVGKPYKLQRSNSQFSGPPVGYHSVEGEPGVHLNYPETVVYNNDAIRPAYLIAYGFPPDHPDTFLSTLSKLFKTPVAA